MIQRGYIILIIGGVLFVAGIIIAAVWAIPFARIFLQENTLINEISIEPGRSVQATTEVTDVSRPVTIAIHIQRPGEGGGAVEDGGGQQQQQQLEQEPNRLIETVKDPVGVTVSSNEFSSDLFTTFQPQSSGNHILNVTNAGARAVTIDATFGYMPFVTSASPPTSEGVGQPLPGIDLSSLFVVIGAGVIATIGFFTMIAGIVILVLDSRRRGVPKSGSSGGVTEGGITYRKD